MLGTNPIRPPVFSNGDTLEIQEIYPTVQGEGPYTGTDAIFVRLGGCNLACHFCDTEFESYQTQTLEEILSTIKNLAKDRSLVVITGGEPFRQPIEALCDALINAGYKVQIETNGTLYRQLHEEVDIICSPKVNSNGQYHMIRPDLLSRITALKFILSKQDSLYNKVGEVGQTTFNIPVYIQPMDEMDEGKNQENLDYAKEFIAKYGYMLSTQTHKALGLK